jgi:hypothetical protein
VRKIAGSTKNIILIPVADDSLQRFLVPDGRLVHKVLVDRVHQSVVVHAHTSHNHPLWPTNQTIS